MSRHSPSRDFALYDFSKAWRAQYARQMRAHGREFDPTTGQHYGDFSVLSSMAATPLYSPATPVYTVAPAAKRKRRAFAAPSPGPVYVPPGRRRSKYTIVGHAPSHPGEKQYLMGPYVTPRSQRLYPKGAVAYIPRRPLIRPVK